jgi:phage tail sheath protein FI
MWINVAGDVAGIRAATNTARNTWDASAGLSYGAVMNCIKLAINPNQAQRDILYKNMINPIVSFNGQGTVVWGQKTLQSKPSAFDRINVRGLFNQMERAISKMAKYYVFTNNDAYTRSRFKSTIEPYLRNIKANRGIYDYYVRCDETNNTPFVVDSNQFIADIAIKPTRTAEFLVLNFISVGTGVDFKEIFA